MFEVNQLLCDHCKSKFKCMNHLTTHINTHKEFTDPNNPSELDCDMCLRRFINNSELNRHIGCYHIPECSTCGECDLYSTTPNSIETVHEGDNHSAVSNNSHILQVDGNISMADSEISYISEHPGAPSSIIPPNTHHIPVHISYDRPPPVKSERILPSPNITIRKDSRLVSALSLPTFSLYNMRSVWSKLDSLADDMVERETDFCFLNEIWENTDNKKHEEKLEKLFHMKNVEYFSTPRASSKRGGGTAIAVSSSKFIITKLNVAIPKPLETLWALLRPKVPTGINKIILCSFYCPPQIQENFLSY